MEEIIVIRATDPDGSVFKAVMDALQEKKAEVIDIAAPAPLCCSSANWKSAPLTGKSFWRERKSASTTGNMPCSTVWLRHLAASTPENNFMRRPGTRYIPMGQIPWKTLFSVCLSNENQAKI